MMNGIQSLSRQEGRGYRGQGKGRLTQGRTLPYCQKKREI
jgi:hypothetical protein